MRNFKQLLGRQVNSPDLKEEYDRWSLCDFVQSVAMPGYVAIEATVDDQRVQSAAARWNVFCEGVFGQQ